MPIYSIAVALGESDPPDKRAVWGGPHTAPVTRMPPADHPSTERVRAFYLGHIADAESAALADHIANCPACSDRLAEAAAGDELLGRLRRAAERKDTDPDAMARAGASLARLTARVPPRPAPRTEPAPALPTVGAYDLLEEVGRGGMGVVYKARHRELQRLVALKMVLAGPFASPTQRLRFRLEAELAARVQHPNIVQVHEVGTHDGHPFLVMEWVGGGTLAGRLGTDPWPAKEAAGLIEVLATAVHAVHAQGVVHRDLKPANVLLAPGPDAAPTRLPGLAPKIADFGVARSQEGGLTGSGVAAGTPEFMAPEQAAGEAARIGPPTDVFALGVVLYRLVTGGLPFTGPNPHAVLSAVTADEPVRPRRTVADVPRDLEAIVLKCLEKDPTRRYPTAAALADDLLRFREGRAVVARPVGKAARFVRWCRRSPGTCALIFTLAAVVLTSLPLVTWKWVEAEDKARQEELARRDAELAGRLAESHRQEGRRLVYAAAVRAAQEAWAGADVARVLELLDEAARGEPGDEDLRGFEWAYLWRLAHPDVRVLNGHRGPVASVTHAPDGKVLASAGHDNTVRLWDLTDGAERAILRGHTGRVTCVAFRPDGTALASASLDGAVRVWDAENKAERFAITGHEGGATAVAFHPDGKVLASAGNDNTVRMWDADTGRAGAVLRGHGDRVTGVAFGRDGKVLASSGQDETLRLWEVGTGKPLLALRGHVGPVNGAAFHPNGKVVASAGGDNTVRLWDVETGHELAVLRGHVGQVRSVAFSADGRLLASAAWDRTVRLWDVVARKELGVLKGHRDQATGVAFGPDGLSLASSAEDGTVRLWDTADGRDAFMIPCRSAGGRDLAFAPDGARIATAEPDGCVRVWNAATGEPTISLRGHDGPVRAVAFAPDGRLASVGDDGSVRVFDPVTGAELRRTAGHGARAGGVAFGPGGRMASAGEDGAVRLWDAATGAESLVLRGHTGSVNRVALSPDGTRVASAGTDTVVRLWDAGTGKELLALRGHAREVLAIAFGPNGRRVASAGEDHSARLWDADTGMTLRALRGHTAAVSGVAYSPDGRRVATIGLDDTVRVWEVAIGRELLVLRAPGSRSARIAFSPDGRRLAVGDGSGAVRVWETEAVPAAILRERARRAGGDEPR